MIKKVVFVLGIASACFLGCVSIPPAPTSTSSSTMSVQTTKTISPYDLVSTSSFYSDSDGDIVNPDPFISIELKFIKKGNSSFYAFSILTMSADRIAEIEKALLEIDGETVALALRDPTQSDAALYVYKVLAQAENELFGRVATAKLARFVLIMKDGLSRTIEMTPSNKRRVSSFLEMNKLHPEYFKRLNGF
jgi:hypothetical protein